MGIARNGVRRSASFATKAEAQKWASTVEFRLRKDTPKTLYDAFRRYEETVSHHHKGKRWEIVRITAFKRQWTDRKLSAVTSDAIAKWRDDRLKVVSSGSVRREMALFGAILSTACREWGWIESNPMAAVKRPLDNKPRDRVISDDERNALVAACRTPLERRMGEAFLFALETGMRAGEICGIRAAHISPSFVLLPETKNGQARRVPLSKAAKVYLPPDGFGLNSKSLDVHFRRVRDRLGFDFTFHATRHTAATRIGHLVGSVLSLFEFADMFGWRDLKIARRYVHTDIAKLAERL